MPQLREQDSLLVINPDSWKKWLGLIALLIALLTTAGSLFSSVIVTNTKLQSELEPITDSTAAALEQSRANNEQMEVLRSQMAEVIEKLDASVLDICIRRANDPFVVQKLNCREYLTGR